MKEKESRSLKKYVSFPEGGGVPFAENEDPIFDNGIPSPENEGFVGTRFLQWGPIF